MPDFISWGVLDHVPVQVQSEHGGCRCAVHDDVAVLGHKQNVGVQHAEVVFHSEDLSLCLIEFELHIDASLRTPLPIMSMTSIFSVVDELLRRDGDCLFPSVMNVVEVI